MKGKKCLDHLLQSRAFSACLLLLLSLLLSLFPVNKASAVNYNVNLSFLKTITSGDNWNYYWKYSDDSTVNTSTNTIVVNRAYLSSSSHPDATLDVIGLCSNNTTTITKDHFYNVRVFTRLSETRNTLGTISNWVSNTDFAVVDVRIIYQNDFSVDTLTSGRLSNPSLSPPLSVDYAVTVDTYPEQYVVYDLMLQARTSGSKNICIGRNTGSVSVYRLPAMTVDSGYTFRFFATSSVLEFEFDTSDKDMNEKDDEDRDNLENQKTESQDSSDDSQEDAENTGTTLLAAFSSFVTAITSASPSNCNLLMNMGNLNLGNVNLCQLSPPAEFQVIASIFLILFCVPLSIATARKVINLFRSFQT